MARADRVEFDQAIAEWVKGLEQCSRRCSLALKLHDELASALRSAGGNAAAEEGFRGQLKSARADFEENLGRECDAVAALFDGLSGTDMAAFGSKVEESLVMPAFAYFNAALSGGDPWPAGLGRFRDAAKDLVCDDEWRDHKVETRVRLVEESQKLWNIFRRLRCGTDGVGVASLDEPTEVLAAYVRGLAGGLLRYDGDKPGELPDCFKHRLRELVAVLDDGCALPAVEPGARDTSGELHLRLREFLHDSFLVSAGPGGKDLACKWCEGRVYFGFNRGAYQCIRPEPGTEGLGAKALPFPKPCACRLLSSSDSFPVFGARLGSSGLTHYYDFVRERNQKEIDGRLRGVGRRIDRTPGWRLAILQRWNSFTPAMAASEGGGYFLYRNDGGIQSGVAIDPGYGFVKNFLAEGFALKDITSVVVTHDHPDHLADFGAIVNLLVEDKNEESWDGVRKPRQVTAWLSKGAFAHLESAIASSPEVFRDTRLLKPSGSGSRNWDALDGSLEISGTKAIHEDLSRRSGHHGYDSIGVIVRINDGDEPALVGLPSDTKYTEEVVDQYAECSVVCVHLGSITPRNFRLVDYFLQQKTSEEVLARKQHLYLPGAFWFVMRLIQVGASGRHSKIMERRDVRLVVLSEFGEEMSRGLRIDLAGKLDSWAQRNSRGRVARVVPGDVGLVLDPVERTMLCSCCEQYYPWTTRLDCESFGDSEQIFYVCPDCRTALSQDDRATIFRSKQTPLMRMTRP